MMTGYAIYQSATISTHTANDSWYEALGDACISIDSISKHSFD